MKQVESDLIRCLRVLALTNPERVQRALRGELDWFLEHIDDLAPELHQRGWIEHRPFVEVPGSVPCTNIFGDGQVREMIVITALGRRQLNAAVLQ